MKHFSEQVWINFVRGAGPSKTNREVENHIAIGCPECSPAWSLWKKIYSIAVHEPAFLCSDQPVQISKRESAARHPQRSPWILARLVFDNLCQPLTAGVRSGVSDTRQMLFDAEGTMVDLVLEIRHQSRTISLVGQVVPKDRNEVAPGEVSIISRSESGHILSKVWANEFGEFQLECAAQERLRLSIEIVGCKPIRFPAMSLNTEIMRLIAEDSTGHC